MDRTRTRRTHPRRDALRLGAIAGVVALAPAVPAAASSPAFRHGVASGDPLPDRVVLWTRVTPTDDATPGSGRGPDVTVDYEIADDAAFRRVVARGCARTGPHRDHTVKLDVAGLRPNRRYYYRFTYDGTRSPVGRTRTAPSRRADVEALRFGVVSCSNWGVGHFAAYRHLAERDDLDAVLHLGDYLYEGHDGTTVPLRPAEPPHETVTLADYRQRHAQYQTDPDLQQLHAAYPWIITVDDHEFADNAWAGGSPSHTEGDEGTWADRKAAALRAYREWMPVRFDGEHVYRRLRYGTLAEITMLDLRGYRSRQLEPGQQDTPDRTMTGGVQTNPDQWDGYRHDRDAVLSWPAERNIADTVFLTGDVHCSWAFEVPGDGYPVRPPLATELVVPSVTSDNIDELTGSPPRTTSLAIEAALLGLNRHLKWVELDSHGYAVLDVTAARIRLDWYFLADRTRRDSPATLAKSVTVGSGSQRLS
ncbi:alkaline phosphatase D family protein [Actinosynnema sp. NPDC047251]|uniref:alkaline phosphatase D family protein n=1 Tax=Saccharothrix espanaensis TaxID=103731 RepID=UPI00030F53FB|nr:alkaline phosphatase D family protein [Saccharothrix espanaensis]